MDAHKLKEKIEEKYGSLDDECGGYLNGEWLSVKNIVDLIDECDGDCYDDLESCEWYWELNFSDVWVPKKLTKKAEKFQKKYGNIDTDQRVSCYG